MAAKAHEVTIHIYPFFILVIESLSSFSNYRSSALAKTSEFNHVFDGVVPNGRAVLTHEPME